MTRILRYGPRFSNSSVQRVRGTGYIHHTKIVNRPVAETKTQQIQRMSLKHRKAAGIEPSLPRFSWDGPAPEKPKPKGPEDAIQKLERQLDGCTATECIQDTETHFIIAMENPEGRPFNACWCKATGSITWLEGRYKPNRRLRNGPPRRKDCGA